MSGVRLGAVSLHTQVVAALAQTTDARKPEGHAPPLRLLAPDGNRKALATFGPTAVDDRTASARLHTGTESMGALTAFVMGLVRTLHDALLRSAEGGSIYERSLAVKHANCGGAIEMLGDSAASPFPPSEKTSLGRPELSTIHLLTGFSTTLESRKLPSIGAFPARHPATAHVTGRSQICTCSPQTFSIDLRPLPSDFILASGNRGLTPKNCCPREWRIFASFRN